MATYDNIVKEVLKRHNRWIHTCWIAHVKELNGLPLRRAPNRLPGRSRANPCPDWARPLIEEAFSRFRII